MAGVGQEPSLYDEVIVKVAKDKGDDDDGDDGGEGPGWEEDGAEIVVMGRK